MFQGSFVSTFLALLLALPAPSAPTPAATPVAAERGELRPAVSSLVDDLQQELARRSVDEARAKQLVEKLAAEFAISGTRERAPIVRVLERCLAAKSQGKPDGELVCHAARALAGMAPESLPVLERALDNKPLLKEKEVGRTLVLALGKTRDKSATKTLLELLDDPDETIVAAAGEALGEYEGANLALRKQLFDAALKSLLQAKEEKDSQVQQTLDPNSPHDAAALKRYELLETAFGTTLQRLSKQDARSAELWLRWWNKNKRADWDDKSKLS
jgi:HEAT repeat protein